MADAAQQEPDPEQPVQIFGSHGIQIGDHNTQHVTYASAVPPVGVQEVSVWWSERWLPFTEPSLTEDVVLAGRQGAASALRSALDGDRSIVGVAGDLSAIEMKAFLAALLVVWATY